MVHEERKCVPLTPTSPDVGCIFTTLFTELTRKDDKKKNTVTAVLRVRTPLLLFSGRGKMLACVSFGGLVN